MRVVDGSFWNKAIKSELDSIMSNQTWELVNVSKGCKPIHSKWVFKRKLRPDGLIDKYTAKLIIRGLTIKRGFTTLAHILI